VKIKDIFRMEKKERGRLKKQWNF